MSRAAVVLRWIAVAPAALIGVLAATFVANIVAAILVFFNSGSDDNWISFLQPETVQRFVQAILVPMGFIWFGSRVAPNHTLTVGWVLFTLSLLFGGAATFAELLRMARGQIGLIELLIQTALWIAGSFAVLKEVQKLATNGPAPGWGGLFSVNEVAPPETATTPYSP
jgi:hypothetical protein